MWKYLNNQFLTVGERNFKKAIILNNYHLSALQKAKTANPNDAEVDKMLTRYTPLANQLVTEYGEWKNLGGIKQASTLNVEQLLATLPTKLNLWDPAIQSKFVKTSPQFKAIFPNGKSGLSKGSKEDRVIAIKNLGIALTGIAELATIKTQVDDFYTQLEVARAAQLGNKSAASKGSEAVARAVAAAMTMQYRNLGLLIDKYYDNPQIIETYFDLATLQESTQTSFTGTLDPSENEAVLVHSFMAGDELRLKIIGNAPARFYLSNTPNGINSETVQVAGNTQLVTDVAEFAVPNYTTYRYLTVVNQSNSVTTKYEVEVL